MTGVAAQTSPAPAGGGFVTAVRHSLTIRRPEFMAAALAFALVAALAVADDLSDLWSAHVLLAYLAIQLGANIGDMANCLADRDLDATYKSRLSTAVYALGIRNVTAQIVATAAVLVVLCGWFVWSTGHWDIALIFGAGIALATQYSLPPLHFKTRGVWQVTQLWTMIYVLPMVFMVRTFEGNRLGWAVLVLIGSYGLVQVGVILLNTAEDYPEDVEFGLRTSVVALGITGAMWVAAAMVTVGGLGSVVAVLALGAPLWSALPLTAVLLWSLAQVVRVAVAVTGKDVDTAMALLRPPARLVPAYLVLAGWTTVFALGVAVVGR